MHVWFICHLESLKKCKVVVSVFTASDISFFEVETQVKEFRESLFEYLIIEDNRECLNLGNLLQDVMNLFVNSVYLEVT